MSQLIGSLLGIGVAVAGALIVYGSLKSAMGIRLDAEQEFIGTDLSIHKISSTPDREVSW
jgi:Amt family ammonium transporter